MKTGLTTILNSISNSDIQTPHGSEKLQQDKLPLSQDLKEEQNETNQIAHMGELLE